MDEMLLLCRGEGPCSYSCEVNDVKWRMKEKKNGHEKGRVSILKFTCE